MVPNPSIAALVPALSSISIRRTVITCDGVEESLAIVTFAATGEVCEAWWPTNELKAAICEMNPDDPDTTNANTVIIRAWRLVSILGTIGQRFILERLRQLEADEWSKSHEGDPAIAKIQDSPEFRDNMQVLSSGEPYGP